MSCHGLLKATVSTSLVLAEFDVPKLERSISYIEQVLREQGPFDGIIGFSQGSLLASVLVMLQNRGLILQVL